MDNWIVVALVYSFIAAAYMMTNDIFKQDGAIAVFWRSLFATGMLLPFAVTATWPDNSLFYMLTLGASFMAAIGDIFLFQAMKDHGGSAISRMTGFRPLLLFLLWPLFNPDAVRTLIAAPLISAGIVACLAVCAFALFTARNNHLSRAALRSFAPCILLFTLSDIACKLAVPFGTTLDTFIVLAFLSCIMMCVVTGTALKTQGKRRIERPKKLWLIGTVNGLLFVGVIMTKPYGLSLTENPSYFNAFAMIMTLWTYLAHRFIFKRDDHASPRAGFVVVACAAVLTVLVEMLP